MEDQRLVAAFCGAVPDLLSFDQTAVHVVAVLVDLAGDSSSKLGDAMYTGVGADGQGGPLRRGDGRLSAQHNEVMPLCAHLCQFFEIGQMTFVNVAPGQTRVHAVYTQNHDLVG